MIHPSDGHTDRETDRRTDGRAIAYTRYSIMLSRVIKDATFKIHSRIIVQRTDVINVTTFTRNLNPLTPAVGI